jgi:hypothetical protein
MRRYVLVWTVVLLGPLAWGASLTAMFWATHPVCQGASHGLIYGIGGACAVLTLSAGLLGWRSLAVERAEHESEHFLLQVGVGASALFALVIALSLVPISMLTPCPV